MTHGVDAAGLNAPAPGTISIPLNLGLNVVTVLAVIGAIGGGFAWGGKMERSIQQNRDAIEHRKQIEELNEKHFEQFKIEIGRQLDTVNQKLDRLIERERTE